MARKPKAGQASGGKAAQPALPARKKSTAPHEPTTATRSVVSMGKALNLTHEQIAERLGIAVHTMEKHYAREIEHGSNDINMRVANNLLSIALQTQDRKAALTASIFWLKSRAGFNDRAGEVKDETAVIESTGPVRVTLKIGTRLGE